MKNTKLTADANARTEAMVHLFVKRTASGPQPEAHAAQGVEENVLRIIGEKATNRRTGARPIVLLSTAVALAAGIALWFFLPQPITFVVSSGTPDNAAFLSVPSPKAQAFVFSEGSVVVVEPSSVVRRPLTTRRGASVVLDHGRLFAQVAHNSRTHWEFETGPFTVDVTGTAFGLEWTPKDGKFAIELREGSVLVKGPFLNKGVRVEKGNRLEVSLNDHQVNLASPRAEAENVGLTKLPEPALAPESGDTTFERPVKRATPPSPRTIGARWPVAVANGHFDDVLREAQQVGRQKLFSTAPLGALRAFADAARYRRDLPAAKAAFEAIRRRFGHSGDAQDGTFFLGWIADEQSQTSAAMHWFSQYLKAYPQGAYAERALGRQAILTASIKGRGAARPLASEYLQRFANGAYAPAIRQLVDARSVSAP